MGSVAGGRLAAAVSNAGALGLVGGAYGDPDWLRTELSRARSESERPWGVGLITWHATPEAVELALSFEPHAFMLSFGDPRPFVPAAKGRDTERTRVFDVVRRHAWPRPYTGRAIRNRFMERWGKREGDLGEAL